MLTAGEMRSLRDDAESLMTDRFEAFAPDGITKGTDEMTVQVFRSIGHTVGKLQGAGSGAGGRDAATEYVEVAQVRQPVLREGMHIPIGAPVPTAGGPDTGWEYVCTRPGPASDPALKGRRYRVTGVPFKSMATARRLDVVEVS